MSCLRGFDVDRSRDATSALQMNCLGENARDSVAPQTQEFLRELIARDGRGRILVVVGRALYVPNLRATEAVALQTA